MRRQFHAQIWLLGVLVATGCVNANGTGTVVGTATIQNCTDANDTQTLNGIKVDDIFAQVLRDPPQPIGGTAILRLNVRLQHGSSTFDVTDGLTIQVLDIAKIAALGPVPVQVGPDQLVRAELEAFYTCPVAPAVGVGTGTITFSKLGDDYGDQVAATYDLQLTDGRGQGAFEGHVSGMFAFTLDRGLPQQRFP